MTPSDNDQGLSIDAMREILQDVCQATCDSDQRDLFEFSSLLAEMVNLHDACEHDADVLQFIRAGLDEIQSLVAEDQSNSDQLEALREEAIDRWGELLSSSDDSDLSHHEHSIASWDAGDQEEGLEEQDDLIAPSVEEISSLLGQLGSISVNGNAQVSLEPVSDTGSSKAVEPSAGLQTPQHTDDVATASNEHEPLPSIQSENASTSIDSLDPELREAFLDDASSCVSSMEESLLRLDNNANDADALNQICRELHTLKGASASVGLADLASQLHELEDRLRDDHTAGRAPEINSLLKSVDTIRARSLVLSKLPQSPRSMAKPVIRPLIPTLCVRHRCRRSQTLAMVPPTMRWCASSRRN